MKPEESASSRPRLLASSRRQWEVDALRGFAIVLMIIYHFIWDLNYFGLFQANLLSGTWQMFPRFIATLFTFTLGLSMTLSYNRELQAGQPPPFSKYLWRGLRIFGLGLFITVTTYFFIGRGFVIFGILHMLGLSTMVGYPFLRLSRWITLTAGLLVLAAGLYMDTLVVVFPWLIWLGVKQAGRYMVDFYPFVPWFGVALVGIFAGYTGYPGGVRRFTLPRWAGAPPVTGLRFLGRHSLLIYMIHQPILIGLLMLFAGV
jgi:uncharacterized membrane protein